MQTRIRTLARRLSVKTLSLRLNLYLVIRRVAAPCTAYRLAFAGWVPA
jgi:hypothetical protein